MLQAYLVRNGYQAHGAFNGDEGLSLWQKEDPDLVLLDLVMPDMSGYDVCAALRSDPALRSVPVILLAGTFESFDPQRAAQAGANPFGHREDCPLAAAQPRSGRCWLIPINATLVTEPACLTSVCLASIRVQR